VLYLGAVPVAYFSRTISLAMIGVVALMWLLPPKSETALENSATTRGHK
jgi:hypothetical protein